jgi:hypothetical protein
MKALHVLVATACLCVAAQLFAEEPLPDTTPGPDIDRMSECVLLDACGYLPAVNHFSVNIESTYENVLTMGTQVPYLPEGYTQETVNGVDYYKLGTIYYRPYLAGDDELFVVSKN